MIQALPYLVEGLAIGLTFWIFYAYNRRRRDARDRRDERRDD